MIKSLLTLSGGQGLERVEHLSPQVGILLGPGPSGLIDRHGVARVGLDDLLLGHVGELIDALLVFLVLGIVLVNFGLRITWHPRL